VRRLAGITVLAAALVVFAVLSSGARAHASSTSRVDVIFDDARGLISGDEFKIAGAAAGTIQKVVVTPDLKARVEAAVESRFMPFHQDATCAIRPEGLIAENYVDCDPGSPNSPPLRGSGENPPTVPVTSTTEPVSLLDLFDIFDVPTRERLAVILDELGIGTAGEGQNFNDIIRRANPALTYARQAISVLVKQKAQLETILDATNTIAAQAATHTADLQSFLDHAAVVTALTAAHRDALAEAINRLPGLLAAAQPALAQLNTVAVDGTPLVQEIHAAVPALNTVSNRLGPFVEVAKPALAKLGDALQRAIPAVRDATPLVVTIRRYLSRSLPSTEQIGALFENLQQHGFVENFLSLVYYLSALTARYDSLGHLGVAYLIDADNGVCNEYATTPVAGCSAHYGSLPTYAANRSATRRGAHAGPSQRTATATKPAATPTPPAAQRPAAAPPASTVPRPGATSPAGPVTQSLQNLIGYLLK
jgi:ABC-type transporter Mla subunit MlaD